MTMPAAEFEQHARGAGDMLAGTAIRVLANGADAEDALQEALFRAYRHRDECRGDARRWLWRIVRNASLDALRRRIRSRPLVALEGVDVAGAEPDEPMLDEHERAAVRRAVQALPVDMRDTVERFYWRGESLLEIAAARGEAVGAVKMRLFRARRRLRARLTPTED